MITRDDIRKTADRMRELGVPDNLNRWLKMTPATYDAHEAAKSRIAAQQRGETILKPAVTIGAKEGVLREQPAEIINGAATVADCPQPATKPAAPAQPAATAATKESSVKTTAAKKTAKPKTSAKVQEPTSENRRAPESAKANARTPVKKPDLKATTGKPAKQKPESKADVIDRLLKRAAGATRKELSDATSYPHVNLRMAAERAGMKLLEKDDHFRIVDKGDVDKAKGDGWKVHAF